VIPKIRSLYNSYISHHMKKQTPWVMRKNPSDGHHRKRTGPFKAGKVDLHHVMKPSYATSDSGRDKGLAPLHGNHAETVRLWPQVIVQCIYNLLDNANKYTPYANLKYASQRKTMNRVMGKVADIASASAKRISARFR
jgi:hypothetical protein